MTKPSSFEERIERWYESQTEEFLRDLEEKHGGFNGLTPREAWHAFFGVPLVQESSNACVPAPVGVAQEGCPPSLEDFQHWLETRAHQASHAFDQVPLVGDTKSAHQWRCSTLISSCRAATSLLIHFKLEQGA